MQGRSKRELISDVFHGHTSVSWPGKNLHSSVKGIEDLPSAMIERNGWRKRERKNQGKQCRQYILMVIMTIEKMKDKRWKLTRDIKHCS